MSNADESGERVNCFTRVRDEKPGAMPSDAGGRARQRGRGQAEEAEVDESRDRIPPPPPIETSALERIAPRGREAAALRKMVRRFAANWLGGQKSKTADLLRTRGFVPRKHLGAIFHELARQKECTIHEGHLMPDHVHMLIAIPPKYAVSSVIGFLKGKSAIAIARRFQGKERNFAGEHFWARGYAVSTVGFEAE